jgi:methionyl-tRNA formyltransferase
MTERSPATPPLDLVPSQEVLQLLATGHVYVDVRTAEEYSLGHIPGAQNVPWQNGTLAGLVPNPEFEAAVAQAWPKQQPLIVGCRSGNRARQAAGRLQALGFEQVRLHLEGWDGSRDAFGRLSPGWSRLGYPVARSPLRVVFFGLPLAAILLHQDGHQLDLVVLSPVNAPGKRRLTRLVGSARVLDGRLLGDAVQARVDAMLAELKPDLLVSWFWTRQLPQRWLDCPRLGGIGAHPSLLPRHRGPNPYFWAIDTGDAETGVSVHRLTERYDEGDVLLRASLAIENRNAWQLARALDRPSLALLRRAVHAYAAGVPPQAEQQLEAAATWAPEPGDQELAVDFRWPCARILQRIRALSPTPGLALDIEGLELTVLSAQKAAQHVRALGPGQAAVWGKPSALLLGTIDATLEIATATVEDTTGACTLRGSALAERVHAHLSTRTTSAQAQEQ